MRCFLIRLLAPIVLVAAVLAALPLYGKLTASSRISPRLATELREGLPAYSVNVELSFRPQLFTLQMLQPFGTVTHTTSDSVGLLSITSGAVRELAGFYWVKKLVPLQNGS